MPGQALLTVNVTEVAGTTIDGTPVTDLPVSAGWRRSKTWVAYSGDGVAVGDELCRSTHSVHDHRDAFDGDPVDGELVNGVTLVVQWTGTGTAYTADLLHDGHFGCVHGDRRVVRRSGTGTLTVTSLTHDAFVVDLADPDVPGHADIAGSAPDDIEDLGSRLDPHGGEGIVGY